MVAKTYNKKELTNDDLARMFQNQFSSLQTEMRDGFSRNEKMHKLFIERFDKVDEDIKGVKQEIRADNVVPRLRRLEYKVGIAKLEE